MTERLGGRQKEYRGEWIVYRPDDFVWIGPCRSFVKAFYARNRMPDPETWLIGRADEHRLALAGRGRWLHLGAAPYPPRQYSYYRGSN